MKEELNSCIYAEVGEGTGGSGRYLSTFATHGDPAPYATTTLALQGKYGTAQVSYSMLGSCLLD